MKTLKLLFALCIILGFATNNANAQKIIGTQTRDWEFTPYPGAFQVPCLEEIVSGSVTEYQSFTNDTYHVRARGVLHGQTSKEEYYISYEFNSYGMGYEPVSFAGSIGYTTSFYLLPALLKHDNKIVAVIRYVGFRIINGNGEIVREINIQSEAADCK